MSHRTIPAAASERSLGVLNNGPGSVERVFAHDTDMAEVALLLPRKLVVALERVARGRGVTLGHLVRGLIRDCLAGKRLLPGAFLVEREEEF
jgi:hypothetical protein